MITAPHIEEVVQPAASSRLPRKRILEVTGSLDPQLGGMSTIVPRLATELTERCLCDAELCIFDVEPALDAVPEASVAAASPVGRTLWPASRAPWVLSASLRRRFDTLLGRADALHIHGLWETRAMVASRLAQAAGKPYVVSAHGMLEPWALASKAWKKRIYAALFERSMLEHAACLHALTSDEADDYRRFGCTRPIAIIPNGVEAPSAEALSAEPFFDRYSQARGRDILLFLGRIHFKKGLDLLVPAWAALAARFPNALLVLAGPDSEGSRAVVEALITSHGIEERVLFTGMLDARMKWSAYQAATCFVLPSYSEGLSVALLEALSAGLPVICTEQCHLTEVKSAGAGWVIRTERNELEQALTAVLENGHSVNRQIGLNGIALARAYRWETVATQMAELYDWISGGPQPVSFTLRGSRQ